MNNIHKNHQKIIAGAILVVIVSFLLIFTFIYKITDDGQGESDLLGDIKTSDGSFAVLELFTSEGCSGCPPADRLFRQVINEAEDKKIRIYALGFHVDYWNDLGWKDIFSRKEYSVRQKGYAGILGSSVYTPQMVVNGKIQFTGSNRQKLHNALSVVLNEKEKLEISIIAISDEDEYLKIRYKLSGSCEQCVINTALVESGLSNKIKSGENRGETLIHDNVVRIFNVVPFNSDEEVKLMKEDLVLSNNMDVIIYGQSLENFEIITADQMQLSL